MTTTKNHVRSRATRSAFGPIQRDKDANPQEETKVALNHTHSHRPSRSVTLLYPPRGSAVRRRRTAVGTFIALLAFVLLIIATTTPAVAQKKKGFDFGTGLPEVPQGKAKSTKPIVYAAEYTLTEGGAAGELRVTATLEGEWHTYSVSQPAGGPKATKITVEEKLVKLTGPIKSDRQPTVSQVDVYPGLPIEEHSGRVTWKVPFEVVGTLDPESTPFTVTIDSQICLPPPTGECRPVNENLRAKYVSAADIPKVVPLRAKDSHADVSVHIEPAEVKPGGEATLVISMKPEKPYHVYPFVEGSSEPNFRTLIVPTKKAELQWGAPMTAADTHALDLGSEKIIYHTGEVEWRIPIRVPDTATEGPHELEVLLGYTTCTDASCDPPTGAKAIGTLTVVSPPSAAPLSPFETTEIKFVDVAKVPGLATWVDFKSDTPPKVAANNVVDTPVAGRHAGQLTFTVLGFALLGGFILNFMPCVLPVIGLKVLGFVEQAGSERSEVVKLNLAYVLGIVVVMWVLAGITVATQSAWGQQFTILEFKLAMAGLVFAMALSFLGVWDIPIPGFATTYKANQLMQREGLSGAFCKGVLTTILATPCSGPFLGFVFAVTSTLVPWGVFVVYTMVGLGMGLPFLWLCLQPGAVKLLPKPGPWMETLKEVLAFPLLLTVVYFVASIGDEYRIATLSMLIAVWFGCWLIGKLPVYAYRHQKVKRWSFALAVIALWGMGSFYLLGPTNSEMPWKQFSSERLAALRSSGKTVMVDFTANWCPNCQWNTKVAIEVPRVVELVKRNEVEPLLADWTDHSNEIYEQIKGLGVEAIPLLAVYPPDPQAEPIILTGTISQDQLLEALKQAGPSRTPGKMTATAPQRPTQAQ